MKEERELTRVRNLDAGFKQVRTLLELSQVEEVLGHCNEISDVLFFRALIRRNEGEVRVGVGKDELLDPGVGIDVLRPRDAEQKFADSKKI